MKILLFVIFAFLLLYAGACLYAYVISDRIIFQPHSSSYRDTGRVLKLQTADGVSIAAVHLPNPAARYTILYSHGNGEDLGDLSGLLEELRGAGFAVFAFDYRGYGTSGGAPSEEGVYRDADAAYDYLMKVLNVEPGRVVALGRSLGGGVAVDLASRKQLGGLVIESSFTTAFRVMTRVSLLPFDKFRSASKIGRVRCPVLVIHGRRDEVVPFSHGEELFSRANEPKFSLWVDGAGHNDLQVVARDRYLQALRDFAAALDKTKATPEN